MIDNVIITIMTLLLCLLEVVLLSTTFFVLCEHIKIHDNFKYSNLQLYNGENLL